jgi:ABC-type oligopeptide transport system ATPase subunit
MAVYGETGSGKTLFGRCIIDFVRKRKDIFRDNSLGPDQKPVLTSSLNAESQMKFLNIWRPIL